MQVYSDALKRHRDECSIQTTRMFSNLSPRQWHGFWIYFSALGTKMTAPVADWIERAGKKCIELGHLETGKNLVKHAKQEAGHDHMMVNDLKALVTLWNISYKKSLSDSALLRHEEIPPIRRYIALHEDVINSKMPYRQVAIEYEIEMLSITTGPFLLDSTSRALGASFLKNLSFLEEHVAIDEGHTKFNEKQLNNLLKTKGVEVSDLIETGSLALEVYSEFLQSCAKLGISLADS